MANSGIAKLISWFTVIIAFIVGAVGVVSFYRYYEFQAMVSELKASGAPCSVTDLLREVADPADDAMTYLDRVGEKSKSFKKEFPTLSLDKHLLIDDPLIQKFDEVSAAYPQIFENLERAANANQMRVAIDTDGDIEFDILQAQSSMLILGLKARILNAQGKPDEAAQVVLSMFKLSRHFDTQPSLLPHLLGNATRRFAIRIFHNLAFVSIPDEMVTQINKQLESCNTTAAFTQAIEMERAMILGYQVEESDPLALALAGKSLLEAMGTAIERSKQPFTILYPTEEPTRLSRFLDSTSGIVDTYNGLRTTEGKHLCFVRALRIINALNSSSTMIDKAEISADDLVDLGVPREMTEDPFTGQLMTIKRVDDQWQVYSQGPDQTDEAGASDKDRTEYGLVAATK